jgi:hypothetical protein
MKTQMTNALNYAGPMTQPRRHERAAWRWACFWYAVATIVAPIVCWASSFFSINPPQPEWQSGDWSDYVGILLAGQASWPMFGLIAYPMASMGLLLMNRRRFSGWFAVRLGIYSGVAIAALYELVMILSTGYLALIISGVAFVGVVVPVTAMWWLIRRIGLKWVLLTLGMLAMLALIVWAVVVTVSSFRFSSMSVLAPAFLAWFITLGAGPLVAMCGLIVMTWWLLRNAYPASAATRITGGLAWLVSFGGSAWATAAAAMHHYQSLPTTPPSHCYIASSAARGHRRFVRTGLVRCADGRTFPVNDQLRILKAGEIAIRAVAPRLHAAMRNVYDAVGPFLAARLSSAFAADVAYVLLKCVEWPTAIALRSTGLMPVAMRFYREGSASLAGAAP